MKLPLAILLAVTAFGCSLGDYTPMPFAPNPPSPPPPGGPPAWLWGMVIGQSGVCIEGATVSVVRGQALGKSARQETPCDVWAYAGGFEFRNLTPGVEMTLRAEAPGYATKEVTVVPTSGGQKAFLIETSPIP